MRYKSRSAPIPTLRRHHGFRWCSVDSRSCCDHSKAWGVVVVVGLASDTIKLPITNIVTRNVTIRCWTSASIEGLCSFLGPIPSGVIQLLVEEIGFYDVFEEVERLTSNRVTGRLFTVHAPEK
jgi:hypothetical protein